MDLHTKKIVGHSFARSMSTDIIKNDLDNAYESQKPDKSLIFHSDLGMQYTSDEFKESIKNHQRIQSFS